MQIYANYLRSNVICKPYQSVQSVQLFSATLSNLRSLAAEDWREICKPYQFSQFSCSTLPFSNLRSSAAEDWREICKPYQAKPKSVTRSWVGSLDDPTRPS